MKPAALFGLIALIPAALNAAPASARVLTMMVCTGDGQPREVSVPLPGRGLPGADGGVCCAKGCHSPSSRKRGQCHFDPSQ